VGFDCACASRCVACCSRRLASCLGGEGERILCYTQPRPSFLLRGKASTPTLYPLSPGLVSHCAPTSSSLLCAKFPPPTLPPSLYTPPTASRSPLPTKPYSFQPSLSPSTPQNPLLLSPRPLNRALVISTSYSLLYLQKVSSLFSFSSSLYLSLLLSSLPLSLNHSIIPLTTNLLDRSPSFFPGVSPSKYLAIFLSREQ